MAEMAIVLALVSCLSFAVFKGVRASISSLNLYTAQKQAQGLAQLMRVDYELAQATRTINTLSDFFGYLYTRQWPLEANTLFSSGDAEFVDLRQLVVDNRGCIQVPLQLKPCWSAQDGIRVEIYRHDLARAIAIARPSALSSGSKALVGLGMDAIMVQNQYFQQVTAWSDLSLEDVDAEIQSRGRQR